VKILLRSTLAVIFLLALGIRLYDLTDLPFDFHATRQWRSIIIARGMYYDRLDSAPPELRQIARDQWAIEGVIEPPVMERLAAFTYGLAGGELIWVARVYSAIFWILGGAAIFLIGRELEAPLAGLFAAIYFLFLPFGMIASRAFQPDPLMVALMAASILALIHWQRRPSIRSAFLAGLLIGLAIFVKTVAGFILGAAFLGMLVGLLLSARAPARTWITLGQLRNLFKNPQVWLISVLAILPAALYYLYGLFIVGFLRNQFELRFFPELWREPAFYIRWVEMATDITGFNVLLIAAVGVFLFQNKPLRGLALGLWIGYLLYSFTFPYHTITHDYYQMPLIPIAAVCLIPVLALLLQQVGRLENRYWVSGALALVVAGGVLFKVWDARVILARRDYRGDAAEWSRYSELLPAGSRVIALTQAYGYPLAYYGWVQVSVWLDESDLELRELAGRTAQELEQHRLNLVEGKEFFVITDLEEYENQPDLQELLAQYPIFADGAGYLIYDLRPVE